MGNLRKSRLAIGIPTLNRSHDLDLTLKSILKNTVLPNKIIIADQSDDERTFELIKNYKNNSNVEFVYLKLEKRGLTYARNVILEQLNNSNDVDIITFLDDDVTLSTDYIEIIRNTFDNDKTIVGVQGFIVQDRKKIPKEFLKLNFKYFFSAPKVFENFENTYPMIVKNGIIIQSEWLSGCNMSYRVECIENEKFEEQFILYALGEDLEFSHRLYLKKKKLVMNTSARLVHRVSDVARLPSKINLIMRFGYRRFMIAKYRDKKRLEELLESYVNSFRNNLGFLKVKFPRKFKEISKFINESLEIVNMYKSEIDDLNLENFNKKILEEMRK